MTKSGGPKRPRANNIKAFKYLEEEKKRLQQLAKPYIDFLSSNPRFFELVEQHQARVESLLKFEKQIQFDVKPLLELQDTAAKFLDTINVLQLSKQLDIGRAIYENHIRSISTIPPSRNRSSENMAKIEFYRRLNESLEDLGENVTEKILAQLLKKGITDAEIGPRPTNLTAASLESEPKYFPLGTTPVKDLQIVLIDDVDDGKMIKFFTPKKGALEMTLEDALFSYKRNEKKPIKIWYTLHCLALKRGKPVRLTKLHASLLNRALMRILRIQKRPISCLGGNLYKPQFKCRVLKK